MTASPLDNGRSRSVANERRKSTAAPDLEQRWLAFMGVADDQVGPRLRAARRRSARYPFLAGLARRLLVFALDWFAPLVVLRTLKRARNLSDEDFDALFRRLREHRVAMVRVAVMFAVMPLMEVAFDDDEPEVSPHPLDGRLEPARAPGDVEKFDVIVIGSGAGGAPVAAQLAVDGASVAIVEKGAMVRPEKAHVALEKYYVNQGLVGAAIGTPVIVMAAESIGGTTSVNSGTSLRPAPEQLEVWDEQLGTDFADGTLDPWLDRAEEAIHVMTPPDELRSRSSRLVAEGLGELGRPETYPLPRNVDGCRGSGRCCFGCTTGAKQSTDRSFLPDAIEAGAALLSRWEATRIRERDDHVEVTIESDNGRRTLRAERLVIAAGALATPGLLRRNRLGDRWREAGRGFKTHPATKVFAHFPDMQRPEHEPGIPQGLGYRPPEWPRVVMEGAEVPACVTGPMLAAGGARFRWWFERHDNLASYGAMIRDRSSGRLRPIFGQPLISYRMHEQDAADLVEAMTLIARAFFAAGAERVLMPWHGADNEFDDPADLDAIAADEIAPEQLLLSGFHPQGTAGMGRVVDSDLRLVGSDRIHVCDASVLPDSPGVNPQVTLMALSLRLADHLR